MIKKIEIIKIMISDVNFDDALEEVKKWLKGGTGKHYIVTPNPEILVAAQKNKTLSQILNQADLALPDGVGILWASRMVGKPLREKVAGVDFMDGLCRMAEKEGFTVGLIGGKSQVAVKAAECLKKSYPKLKVVLAAEEWNSVSALSSYADSNPAGPVSLHPHPTSSPDIHRGAGARWGAPALATRQLANNKIRNSQPASPAGGFAIRNSIIDLLFVAFGAPKQEIWIKNNLNNLPVRAAMGVGGAFDYLSGRVTRAPNWIQNLGLEWFFRLIRQPWRMKRQLALLKFVILVLKEKYFLRPIDLRVK